MNGHAALTLRDAVDPKVYQRIRYFVVYSTMTALVVVLCILCAGLPISGSLAASGVGHITYLIVKLEALFRVGGGAGRGNIYMSPEDSIKWANSSSYERLLALCSLRHRILGLELLLTSTVVCAFGYFRLMSSYSSSVVCIAVVN